MGRPRGSSKKSAYKPKNCSNRRKKSVTFNDQVSFCSFEKAPAVAVPEGFINQMDDNQYINEIFRNFNANLLLANWKGKEAGLELAEELSREQNAAEIIKSLMVKCQGLTKELAAVKTTNSVLKVENDYLDGKVLDLQEIVKKFRAYAPGLYWIDDECVHRPMDVQSLLTGLETGQEAQNSLHHVPEDELGGWTSSGASLSQVLGGTAGLEAQNSLHHDGICCKKNLSQLLERPAQLTGQSARNQLYHVPETGTDVTSKSGRSGLPLSQVLGGIAQVTGLTGPATEQEVQNSLHHDGICCKTDLSQVPGRPAQLTGQNAGNQLYHVSEAGTDVPGQVPSRPAHLTGQKATNQLYHVPNASTNFSDRSELSLAQLPSRPAQLTGQNATNQLHHVHDAAPIPFAYAKLTVQQFQDLLPLLPDTVIPVANAPQPSLQNRKSTRPDSSPAIMSSSRSRSAPLILTRDDDIDGVNSKRWGEYVSQQRKGNNTLDSNSKRGGGGGWIKLDKKKKTSTSTSSHPKPPPIPPIMNIRAIWISIYAYCTAHPLYQSSSHGLEALVNPDGPLILPQLVEKPVSAFRLWQTDMLSKGVTDTCATGYIALSSEQKKWYEGRREAIQEEHDRQILAGVIEV